MYSKIATITILFLASSVFSYTYATPITASLCIEANTSLSNDDNTFRAYKKWFRPLSDLTVSASASDSNGDYSNHAHGDGSAVWADDGLSGSVTFENYGWELNAIKGSVSVHSRWSYSFVADSNSQFIMNYSVLGSGYTYGLQGWEISLNDVSYHLSSDAYDPTASGDFYQDLIAGQTYTVRLDNRANLGWQWNENFDYYRQSSMTGAFDWRVTSSVPEPATFSILSLGLLGFGFMNRRKHRA